MGGGSSLPVVPPTLGAEYHVTYKAEEAPHFVQSIGGVRAVHFAEKGLASKEECPPTTLVQIFVDLVGKGAKGGNVATQHEFPVPPLNADKSAPPPMSEAEITRISYQDYFDAAKAVGGGLTALGFEPRDGVCIFGFNSPKWNQAAVSAMFAGGCFTGIYPSDTVPQVQWKARLSNSSVAFAESQAAASMFLASADELPHLKAVVHWNEHFPAGSAPHKRADGSEVQLLSWAEVEALGKEAANVAKVEERMGNVKPTDCCDLIFTSGTTGNPKAVMISHDNVVFMTRSMLATLSNYVDATAAQRSLSYLPLSHIAGSLTDIFVPIVATHDFEGPGWAVTVARPYDLKAGSLKDRLQMCRPTMFMGVPRVWEKIHEKMLILGASIKGTKRKVANIAKGKALKFAEERQIGHSGKVPFGYKTMQGLLLDKIKMKLGLDKCLIGFTGAAPMKLETLRYFGSIGIQVNECYGMSETTGVSTLGTPDSHIWGSCGFPLPGVEVEVFSVDAGGDPNKKSLCPRATDIFNPTEAQQGEICFRGRNIMLGYLANPALGEAHVAEMLKKNRAAIDDDGWLHSGDKGCKGDNNMLRVTGRFKELIIGAGGENIAPVPIEDAILAKCKAVSNCIMVGDQRKYVHPFLFYSLSEPSSDPRDFWQQTGSTYASSRSRPSARPASCPARRSSRAPPPRSSTASPPYPKLSPATPSSRRCWTPSQASTRTATSAPATLLPCRSFPFSPPTLASSPASSRPPSSSSDPSWRASTRPSSTPCTKARTHTCPTPPRRHPPQQQPRRLSISRDKNIPNKKRFQSF